MTNPLGELINKGVSIWLDDLSRQRLVDGSLADLIARDHVTGVSTTRRSSKAITGSDACAGQLRDLSTRGVGVAEVQRTLTVFDVCWACDVLRPVYLGSAAE